MIPAEALQYLAGIAQDFARTLPPSAQAPFANACNEALQALAPLVSAPEAGAMVNGDPEAAKRVEGRKREAPDRAPGLGPGR
jgi:hypothetical protein